MILQKTFPPQRIKLGLESEFRDEVFEELVDIIVRDFRSGGVTTKQDLGLSSANRNGAGTVDRAAIIEALEKREAKMSTGIKKGLAIPHATVAGLPRFIGALGISNKGIDYGSLDGEPVYIVFLLLSPPEDSEAHLQALKQIASLMDNEQYINKLLEATTAEKAFSILRSFEERD
jgi:PTS system fructose-specific IIC component/PTS system nitrogen regulatory IIA component